MKILITVLLYLLCFCLPLWAIDKNEATEILKLGYPNYKFLAEPIQAYTPDNNDTVWIVFQYLPKLPDYLTLTAVDQNGRITSKNTGSYKEQVSKFLDTTECQIAIEKQLGFCPISLKLLHCTNTRSCIECQDTGRLFWCFMDPEGNPFLLLQNMNVYKDIDFSISCKLCSGAQK